ncbi:right-handed parallel beta-helix repeat-containing protein [Dankookia rubra]|uniref:right-handed parallel beta-helix repeat-containing protein n=1 Tax=Dankookia rubra TaxID=1442381 RepID=UPI001409FD04|nr:right-handed parallel beta-helix repeat-containing protein [Dankookia rubra]
MCILPSNFFERTAKGTVIFVVILLGNCYSGFSMSIAINRLPESFMAEQVVSKHADLYVSPTGDDFNPGTLSAPLRTFQKAVNVARPGSVILVRGGTYNQTVKFSQNNSGKAGKYILFAAYPGEVPIIDAINLVLPENSAPIEINASYVRVSGFTVKNVRGNSTQFGILAENASNVVIDRNHTIQTASAGIGSWYSSYVVVRDNKVQDGRTTGTQECLSVNGTSYFEISHNVVWNTQVWPEKCEGIDVKNGSKYGVISKNIVHDLPLEGIYVDAYQEGVTEYIEIHGNLIYNTSMGIALTSEVSATLKNIKIYNNIIRNTFYMGIGFPAWGPTTGAISNIQIFNNTIDNRNAKYETNPTGFFLQFPRIFSLTIRNNIILTSGAAFVIDGAIIKDFIVDYNLIVAAKFCEGGNINDVRNIYSDPLFIDADQGNYRLSAQSPAIDKGSKLVKLYLDFYETPRPQGGSIDIGAVEYSKNGF